MLSKVLKQYISETVSVSQVPSASINLFDVIPVSNEWLLREDCQTVSILPIISKLLEEISYDKVLAHLHSV